MRPQPCSPFWRQQHSLRSRRRSGQRLHRPSWQTAAYYAAAVGISEAALYQHYETFRKAEGRLPCDPEAEAYFLEGEPAETILPDPVYTDDEITQRILSLKAAFPEVLPWKGGSHL